MTTALLIPVPKFRAFDANGDPLAGGKVWTYDTGTTTPRPTFTDANSGIPNTNPVILDSRGEADIWLDGIYRIQLLDSNDVQQYVEDDIQGGNASTAGSESTAGILQLATVAETITGTNNTKAVHPLGAKSAAAFSILPVKTTMVNADTIAITDSAAGSINKQISYADLVTALNLSGGTGVTVPNGGTGRITLTDHGVLIGAGVNPINTTTAGTAGQVLTSNGPATDPSFQDVASGQTLQSIYFENTTASTMAVHIPDDDTIPQITEGNQIFSGSITPSSITGRIRVTVNVCGSKQDGTGNDATCLALFADGAANAIAAVCHTQSGQDYAPGFNMVLVNEYTPGDTASHLFTVRIGAGSTGVMLNGKYPGRKYGGVSKCTMLLEEIS